MERGTWPIVVGGCHRSGTSLVRRILDAHPRIHCGPEVPFFRDFFGDYADDPLQHLRFSTAARSILGQEELLDVLGRAFVEVHERAARHAGKARWADKAPENVLYLEQWGRLLGSNWLFVHVVRNPLDTLASMDRRFPLTLPSDLEGRIDFYLRYTRSGLDFARAHRERCVVLIYEALCEAPDPTLAELMRSLGEDLEAGQLAFNEVPHQAGLEDPSIDGATGIHRGSIGRWRSVLGDAEAESAWSRTRALWAELDPDGRYAPV